jgi:hypothetical protein
MARLAAILIVELLSLKGATMPRADEIFTSGPETVIAQSNSIVAGPVTNFSRRTLQSDAPSGTPLHWEIAGDIVHPLVLKGDPPALPLHFTRHEQAAFLDRQDAASWETDFLEWQDGDQAVVFLQGAGKTAALRVYPSGSGERDLAAIVKRIAAIQAIADPSARFGAWQNAIKSAPTATERRAALRSLTAMNKPWSDLSATFGDETTFAAPAMRTFVFGLVAYGIMHSRWTDAGAPAGFLCERLERETDRDVLLQEIAMCGTLLAFATEQGYREERQPLTDQLRRCLSRRCQDGNQEATEACKEVLASYAR